MSAWELTLTESVPPSCRHVATTVLSARGGLEAIQANREGLRQLGAGRYSLVLRDEK